LDAVGSTSHFLLLLPGKSSRDRFYESENAVHALFVLFNAILSK